MDKVAVFIVVGVIVVALLAAWCFALGALGMVLYDGLAPAEWVRPNYLQWTGIAFVFSLIFGGGGKAAS